MNALDSRARRWFLAALFALGCTTATAEPIDRKLLGEPAHKVVYQLNKADADYINGILFSAGEMLRRYGDDIQIVITVIGPGIHLLAKQPQRPIPAEARARAASLAAYGVEFHACGNTLKSLHWSATDVLDYATVVDVGADDLMRLQEQGYAYISW
ncbi:MAG: DsrE family protein [Gammaproteobacteria bacterium]|nr:DsrE family protein [Gammaproteobacteria bacterium]